MWNVYRVVRTYVHDSLGEISCNFFMRITFMKDKGPSIL